MTGMSVEVMREYLSRSVIIFDQLAQYASWNQQGGGTNMRGGTSTVVKIPKDQFRPMTRAELNGL